ncbi:MAG: aminotransferase class III-fold pyridoxal phosphate-dependent enzyme [Candidatus Nanopelagicales bacterium]
MTQSQDIAGIDAVLHALPSRITPDVAVAVAAQTFGVDASLATDLGSERDQTFVLCDTAGERLAVMKVSNPAEDPARLDMEALGGPGAGVDSCRAPWQGPDALQWVRMYDVLPGRARLDPLTLDDVALQAWGDTTARLGRALRGFIHPGAIRRLPWDVQHAAACRPMIPAIADPYARLAVTAVLDRFDDVVAPRWPVLRAQVVHGDLTVDNVLADEDGIITGIIDFGDMSHTALVVDLASVLDSLGTDRTGEEMFRTARLVLDGYQRITPLETDELTLMGELWAARAAVGVAIASWRAAEGLEDPDYAQRYNASALATVEQVLSTGWARSAELLGAPRSGPMALMPAPAQALDAGNTRRALAQRRDAVFGPAMEPLSYFDPLEMAAADGVWMVDTEGRRYLDMYNNVACVGHSHPRVASAVARQWRVLNTNLRYLHHSAIELAERLTSTCPPSLDTVLFVNSGSEANDLAWRLAAHHTGSSGALCTAFAYHGITAALAELSPETLFTSGPAPTGINQVERWAPPDGYRGLHTDTSEFVAGLERLRQRGVAPAATILDGVLQSDGVLDLDPEYVQELLRLTHAAGGLWIADEVQGGHGRTGDAMWSFQRFGIEPDLVTLGKPMGNGQPVGAVITRRELVEKFSHDTVFFSTFAGNQVSMAAAHAVLDVLADEHVLARVQVAGAELRRAVRAATAHDDRVGDVRGMGLANAIEIVRDRQSQLPDATTAARVKERLRDLGVLVGTTGPAGNVLKVRPPLAFTAALVPTFVSALEHALADVTG